MLYDSRTMHCGGENSSDKRRSVLCISCMGPGIRPDGTTWTMLPSLRNQITLTKLPLPAIRPPPPPRPSQRPVDHRCPSPCIDFCRHALTCTDVQRHS